MATRKEWVGFVRETHKILLRLKREETSHEERNDQESLCEKGGMCDEQPWQKENILIQL